MTVMTVKRPANRFELLRLMPKGLRWAEIGVLRGEFSQQIWTVTDPAHLHLVDPWNCPYPWTDDKTKISELTYGLDNMREVTSRFAGCPKVSMWRMTSAEFFAPSRMARLDAVYVDGAHDYASVRDDLDGALNAINEQGWILGHDYCEGGVMSGVKRAVDEFLGDYKLHLWALTDEPLAPVHRVSEADKLRPAETAYNSFCIKVGK